MHESSSAFNTRTDWPQLHIGRLATDIDPPGGHLNDHMTNNDIGCSCGLCSLEITVLNCLVRLLAHICRAAVIENHLNENLIRWVKSFNGSEESGSFTVIFDTSTFGEGTISRHGAKPDVHPAEMPGAKQSGVGAVKEVTTIHKKVDGAFTGVQSRYRPCRSGIKLLQLSLKKL